jgi:hypothetical protein
MVVARDFLSGPKGVTTHALNRIGGERLFRWRLRLVLRAVERTAQRDSAPARGPA